MPPPVFYWKKDNETIPFTRERIRYSLLPRSKGLPSSGGLTGHQDKSVIFSIWLLSLSMMRLSFIPVIVRIKNVFLFVPKRQSMVMDVPQF